MKQWYACYTRSRAEKASAARLARADIACYLPLRKERRQWTDRIKTVEVPLFTSYVFVHVEPHEFYKTRLEGDLVGFVVFEGKPVPIPDEQIEAVKRLVNAGAALETVPANMQPGQKIEVVKGPLMGLQGEMVRHQGRHRMLVRLNSIGQGVLIEMELENVAEALEEVIGRG